MAFPTAGLFVRYEARLDTGHANADPIAQIEDQSGNARHLTQPTSAFQPTYRTGVVGGEPAYRFDGVDDYSDNTGVPWSPTGLTLSLVLSSGAAEATSRVWPAGVSDATTRVAAIVESQTGGVGDWGSFFRTSAGTVNPNTSGVDTTAWSVLTLTWDGSTVKIYRNGAEVTSNALAGTISVDEIWFARFVSTFFSGDVALYGAWTGALDATARADLHTYVQDTYGITVSDYSGGGGSDDRDVSFSASIPLQSLAATVSRSLPTFEASFAASVPLQALSATVTRTIPERTASFAATVPLQSLAASLERTIPTFEASFAATIPLQSLVVTIAGEGIAVQFSATIPVQTLSAVVARVIPKHPGWVDGTRARLGGGSFPSCGPVTDSAWDEDAWDPDAWGEDTGFAASTIQTRDNGDWPACGRTRGGGIGSSVWDPDAWDPDAWDIEAWGNV